MNINSCVLIIDIPNWKIQTISSNNMNRRVHITYYNFLLPQEKKYVFLEKWMILGC